MHTGSGPRQQGTDCGRGWSFGGWKVGFTNREIWSRWGLDRPIVAPVYRETIFHAPLRTPAHVPLGTRAAPRIEVEAVFGFAAPLTGSPDWVALGAELVDCHYEGWRLHPADAVADFGLHAGLVVGPSVPMTGDEGWRSNPADALRRMEVSLSANGERRAEGTGDAVLGSPMNVLRELGGSGAAGSGLAPRMAAYGFPAPPTQAPHPRYLVSTGTLTPLVGGAAWNAVRGRVGFAPFLLFRIGITWGDHLPSSPRWRPSC